MTSEARQFKSIIEQIKAYIDNYPGTQGELAKQANISQSTISRFSTSTNRKRLSKGVRRLCIYANINIDEAVNALKPDPCTNTELISALRDVWNGTPAHAKALAKIIRDLKPFILDR